jgi:aminoglycoside phosphotransferase (APT) family kinase protein
MSRDAAEVRSGEELPRERLASWLGSRLAGGEEIQILQFPAGHSNLTYLIRTHIPASEYVLRRAPLGPVPARAHDMVREFRVLSAVYPHYRLAPQPVTVCEDASIIGTPFFVMERRRGVVARHGVPGEYRHKADAPAQMSQALIDSLADLHLIDVEAAGLGGLGRPVGFLQRQVEGWSERWKRAVTEPVPAMDPVMEWLASERPEPRRVAMLHQDYKFDNVMFAPRDPSRMTAVLDWEMATLGDPLADLGLTLTYWSLPEAQKVAGMEQGAGWWNRERMIERYVEKTGFSVEGLHWYEVLGTFKLAVIVQQIYARYAHGQTADPRFAAMGDMAAGLAERAGRMIRGLDWF